jgi:hypothetical protein
LSLGETEKDTAFIFETHQIEFINGFKASTSLAVVDWQLMTLETKLKLLSFQEFLGWL